MLQGGEVVFMKKKSKHLNSNLLIELNMCDIMRRFALVSDSTAKLQLANVFSPIAKN